jgi:hypothetical protein
VIRRGLAILALWTLAVLSAAQIEISPPPGKKTPVNLGETPVFSNPGRPDGAAAPPAGGDAILTEGGDPITTEGGDQIIIE